MGNEEKEKLPDSQEENKPKEEQRESQSPEEKKGEKPKRETRKFGLQKDIPSVFDSIPQEENVNLESSLFEKTKKDTAPQASPPEGEKIIEKKEEGKAAEKEVKPAALKKSPEEILRSTPIPQESVVQAGIPLPVRKSSGSEKNQAATLVKKEEPKKHILSTISSSIVNAISSAKDNIGYILSGKGVSPRNMLGIDIGTSSIKIISLYKSSAGYIVDKLFYREIPIELLDGPKEKIDEYKKAEIKKILSDLKVSTNLAVSTFQDQAMIIRNVKLPLVSQKELEKAIRFKTESMFSLKLSDYCFDYVQLGETVERGIKQLEVLVALVPVDVMERHVSMLEETGLKLIAAELCPFSLAYTIDEEEAMASNEVIAFLDIGFSQSTFNIYHDGYVRFSRSITSASGDMMTKEISKVSKESYQSSEAIKRASDISFDNVPEGDPTMDMEGASVDSLPKEIRIAQVIKNILDKLISELNLSFDYFSYQETQSRIKKIDRMILSGGGTSLKNIDDYLYRNMGIKIEYCDPFRNVMTRSDAIDGKFRLGMSHCFPPAFGASLRLKNV